MLDTVSRLEYRGGETHTNDALDQARNSVFGQAGDRPNVLNVVIIITDGVPFPDFRRTPTINSAASLQSISTIFAIGITELIDVNLLSLLSSQPRVMDVNYFTSPDFEQLELSLQPILRSVCATPPPPTLPCKYASCGGHQQQLVRPL